MDMGKHPLIFQLAIKIDKETFIDLYLFNLFYCCLNPLFSLYCTNVIKQIHNTNVGPKSIP